MFRRYALFLFELSGSLGKGNGGTKKKMEVSSPRVRVWGLRGERSWVGGLAVGPSRRESGREKKRKETGGGVWAYAELGRAEEKEHRPVCWEKKEKASLGQERKKKEGKQTGQAQKEKKKTGRTGRAGHLGRLLGGVFLLFYFLSSFLDPILYYSSNF